MRGSNMFVRIILSITISLSTSLAATAAEHKQVAFLTPADGHAETSLFVRQCVGLESSIKEIRNVLAQAKQAEKLTSIEIAEYERRLSEIETEFKATKASSWQLAYSEKQMFAGRLYELASAVNGKLLPPPPAVALTDEQLQADYKSVQSKIANYVREGHLVASQSRQLKSQAKRIYQKGIASKQSDAIQIASRDLRRLNDKVAVQAAYRLKPQVNEASPFLLTPRLY